MPKWKTKQTGELLQAIVSLKNTEEAGRFFRDLLTEQEILEFGRRWRAAIMLDSAIPYTTIVKTTGLSSTTIARISKWLNKGMGGYRLILNRSGHRHNSIPSGKGLC